MEVSPPVRLTTTAVSFIDGLPAVGFGDNGLALKIDGNHLNNDPNNRLGLPEGFMSSALLAYMPQVVR